MIILRSNSQNFTFFTKNFIYKIKDGKGPEINEKYPMAQEEESDNARLPNRREVFGQETPLAYAIIKPEILTNIDSTALMVEVRRLREADERFYGEISTIIDEQDGKSSGTRAKSIHQLQGIEVKKIADAIMKYFDTPTPFIFLTDEQKNFVFNVLNQSRNFQKIISLAQALETSVDKKFINHYFIQNCIANAYYERGVEVLSQGDEAQAADLFLESKKYLLKIAKETTNKFRQAEAYSKLGEVYCKQGDFLKKKGGKENKGHGSFLSKGIEYLEKAYTIDFNGNIGTRLIQQIIKKAAQEKDPNRQEAIMQHAQWLASIVYLSVLKNGSFQSADFEHHANFLKMYLFIIHSIPIITGGELNFYKTLINNVLQAKKTDQQMQTLVEELKELSQNLGAVSDPSQKFHIRQMRNLLSEYIRALEAPKKMQHLKSQEDKSLWGKAFYFTEINSTGISGNIQFNGQLHPSIVNEWDLEVADNLVAELGLDTVYDLDGFNTTADKFLRARFATDPLEDLKSPEHQIFDKFTRNFLKIMGIEKYEDARTNVMADVFLGAGDCRHHAYAKSLLFTAWRKKIANNHLRETYGNPDPTLSEADTRIKKWLGKVCPLLLTHMLVTDVVIKADVIAPKKYEARRDEQGHFIKGNGEAVAMEDHTLTIALQLDPIYNRVIKAQICDSFYHHNFPFAKVDLPLSTPVDKEGNFVLHGGIIKVRNESTGELVNVDVTLHPASYAGSRSSARTDYIIKDIRPTTPQIRGMDIHEEMGSIDNWGPKRPKVVSEFMNKIADNAR